ncbi:hypothetical protein ACH50O_00850 [Methylomonas sp. 2BW1-5-20]|uniref:hypothetical protein n=1 Tax=Methylomonas sp. 2BW1-5-20 TaxID=3376686 RepID=UPI00404E3A7E
MQIDTAHPTGRVAISITEGQPSYRILDRQAYDCIPGRDCSITAVWPYENPGTVRYFWM